MRTIETTLYQYDELDESAQERARDWYREGIFDYDWWEHIYEDASTIGLKITSFDLDRNKHAKGDLFLNAREVCENIMNEHGKDCETHLLAIRYLEEWHKADKEYDSAVKALPEDENLEDSMMSLDDTYESLCDELGNDFTAELLEEYASILQKETEYMESDEQVIEGIQANEYEFTEDGRKA